MFFFHGGLHILRNTLPTLFSANRVTSQPGPRRSRNPLGEAVRPCLETISSSNRMNRSHPRVRGSKETFPVPPSMPAVSAAGKKTAVGAQGRIVFIPGLKFFWTNAAAPASEWRPQITSYRPRHRPPS